MNDQLKKKWWTGKDKCPKCKRYADRITSIGTFLILCTCKNCCHQWTYRIPSKDDVQRRILSKAHDRLMDTYRQAQ